MNRENRTHRYVENRRQRLPHINTAQMNRGRKFSSYNSGGNNTIGIRLTNNASPLQKIDLQHCPEFKKDGNCSLLNSCPYYHEGIDCFRFFSHKYCPFSAKECRYKHRVVSGSLRESLERQQLRTDNISYSLSNNKYSRDGDRKEKGTKYNDFRESFRNIHILRDKRSRGILQDTKDYRLIRDNKVEQDIKTLKERERRFKEKDKQLRQEEYNKYREKRDSNVDNHGEHDGISEKSLTEEDTRETEKESYFSEEITDIRNRDSVKMDGWETEDIKQEDEEDQVQAYVLEEVRENSMERERSFEEESNCIHEVFSDQIEFKEVEKEDQLERDEEYDKVVEDGESIDEEIRQTPDRIEEEQPHGNNIVQQWNVNRGLDLGSESPLQDTSEWSINDADERVTDNIESDTLLTKGDEIYEEGCIEQQIIESEPLTPTSEAESQKDGELKERKVLELGAIPSPQKSEGSQSRQDDNKDIQEKKDFKNSAISDSVELNRQTWKICYSSRGEKYYFCSATGESTWDPYQQNRNFSKTIVREYEEKFSRYGDDGRGKEKQRTMDGDRFRVKTTTETRGSIRPRSPGYGERIPAYDRGWERGWDTKYYEFSRGYEYGYDHHGRKEEWRKDPREREIMSKFYDPYSRAPFYKYDYGMGYKYDISSKYYDDYRDYARYMEKEREYNRDRYYEPSWDDRKRRRSRESEIPKPNSAEKNKKRPKSEANTSESQQETKQESLDQMNIGNEKDDAQKETSQLETAELTQSTVEEKQILESWKPTKKTPTTIIADLPVSYKMAGPELTKIIKKLKVCESAEVDDTKIQDSKNQTIFCLSCHSHVGLKNFFFLLGDILPSCEECTKKKANSKYI